MQGKRLRDKKGGTGSRRNFTVVIAIAVIGIVGTSLFAQVNSRRKSQSHSTEVSVMSLSANAPSKEYIYAGSKLVATEEPISFGDQGIASNIFYNDILKIARRRVTLGCGGGNYCPNDSVTRDQMAAFIIRALGDFYPPTPPSQRFTDVPSTNVFYNFIDEMAIKQITLGCGGGNYCPADIVAHDAMAAFIIRALHQSGYVPTPPATQRFTDVPASNPFYAYIDEYAQRGIWQGCTDGQQHSTFCPSDPVTRAQMAHILVQAFGANWQ